MVSRGAELDYDKVRAALERLGLAVLGQMRALQVAAARRDAAALQAVVGKDGEIDALELTLDKLGRAFIELRAPVGPDFRFVMGALDIARNLERIGDCIEYVARHLAENPALGDEFREGAVAIGGMIDKGADILEQAYAAWRQNDARLAGIVPTQDDYVDALQEKIYGMVVTEVRATRLDVETGMVALLVANKLESIADIACHIAETVVFMILAKQIRHERGATAGSAAKVETEG